MKYILLRRIYLQSIQNMQTILLNLLSARIYALINMLLKEPS